MLSGEAVTGLLNLLLEAGDATEGSQPHLSVAFDSCVLMIVDAAQEQGVSVDLESLGIASFGVVGAD